MYELAQPGGAVFNTSLLTKICPPSAATEAAENLLASCAEWAEGGRVMLRKISSVMKSDVFHLSTKATVRQAACLMKEKGCGAVLVTTKGQLEGIFTERDVVNRVVAAMRDPATTTLGEVMTRQPDVVEPARLAIEALRMMEEGGYRHLPVMNRGRVVGIVSRRDFFGEEKAEIESERHYWENVR